MSENMQENTSENTSEQNSYMSYEETLRKCLYGEGVDFPIGYGLYIIHVQNHEQVALDKDWIYGKPMPDNVKAIREAYARAEKDSSAESQAFIRRIEFFYNVFHRKDSVSMATFLKNLSRPGLVDDTQVQYDALKRALPYTNNEQRWTILRLIAKNEHKTLDDLYDLMRGLVPALGVHHSDKTKQEVQALMNDMIPLAEEELNTEMNAEIPDVDHIQNICRLIGYALRIAQEMGAPRDYVDQVKERFDVEKLLEVNGPTYIAQYAKSQEERIAELNQKIKTLEEDKKTLDQQVSNKDSQIRQTEKDRDVYKAKMNEQQEEIEKKKQQNAHQNNYINELKTQIKELTTMIENLNNDANNTRAGMFSKGTEKLKEKIANMNSEMQRVLNSDANSL